jgi:hypothetical protein
LVPKIISLIRPHIRQENFPATPHNLEPSRDGLRSGLLLPDLIFNRVRFQTI